MGEPLLNLVVLRSRDLEAAKRFYEAVGLAFREERHGNGPRHFAATLASGVVLELYPANASGVNDARSTVGVRLGFVVDQLERVVSTAVEVGASVVSRNPTRAVVTDPDGRKVELTASR